MHYARVRSAGIVLLSALSIISCTEAQLSQVVQNVGQNMAKNMCAQGKGPASAAQEYCLYLTDLQISKDGAIPEVGVILVSRTNQHYFIRLTNASLSDNLGNRWLLYGSSGIPRDNMTQFDPASEAQGSIRFITQNRTNPGTVFTVDGEINLFPADNLGNRLSNTPIIRGFRITGLRMMQAPAQTMQKETVPLSATAPERDVQGGAPRADTATATQTSGLEKLSSGVIAIAGSRTWDTLDISGFKIGALPEEVSQNLKQNDVPLVVQEYQAELSDVPNTKYLSHVVGKSKDSDYMVGGELELILASFAPVPNKPFIGQISRIRRYPNGQQLAIENVRQALLEKYGDPSFKIVGPSGMMYEEWTWVFDRKGVQIAPPSLERQCSFAGLVGMWFRNANSLFASHSREMDQCGRVLSVHMQFDKANRVWQIQSFLMDNFLVQEALARTTAMVSDYKNKQLQKQIKEAERQGKPKL